MKGIDDIDTQIQIFEEYQDGSTTGIDGSVGFLGDSKSFAKGNTPRPRADFDADAVAGWEYMPCMRDVVCQVVSSVTVMLISFVGIQQSLDADRVFF